MKKIYVGNLPYNTTEQELMDAFAQYGDIENVILIKDRMTGRSKGFGFVVFGDSSAAQNALSMHGQQLNGRNLKVNMAREEGSSGSGGFRERRPHHRGDRGDFRGDRGHQDRDRE